MPDQQTDNPLAEVRAALEKARDSYFNHEPNLGYLEVALAALSRMEQAGGWDGLGPEKQREVWRRSLLASRDEHAGGWQPIATAPKDEMFLGYVWSDIRKAGYPVVATWDERGRYFIDEDGAELYRLTHWRLPPPPPAAEQKP